MYLCLGVFMNLLSKEVFGKPNYATQGNIFETIHNKFGNFEYAPLSGASISKYFNCKQEINDNVIQEITRLKKTDTSLLFDNLNAIAIDLQKNIIAESKQKDLVSAIIYIIEHDSEISASTFIGKPDYYTRNNLLRTKEIVLTEFLENVLYYVFNERKNKDPRGEETAKWIHNGEYKTVGKKDIIVISYYHNSINDLSPVYSTSKANDNLQSISCPFPKQQKATLCNELTRGTFKCTVDDVLFRDHDYKKITNLLQSSSNNILINGIGGCGKTSIARVIYSNLKDNYDCYGWINYTYDIKHSFLSSLHIDDRSYTATTTVGIQERWYHLLNALSTSSQTKLFIIDNVDSVDNIQNPITDKELHNISNLPNTTIIITSRLPYIPGFSKVYTLKNLGDDSNCDICIELFYSFNKYASQHRERNEGIIRKLCKLAGYNTLVIELLAKGCNYYIDSLEEYYEHLCNNHFQIPYEYTVLTSHDYNEIVTNSPNKSYYSIGNETIASQLYKLFNISTRRTIEQLVLWDFHYLPENFKVSKEELKTLMGFQISDIDNLVKEGWIKYQDDYFSLHPLIRQAIYCSPQTWEHYWKKKQKYVYEGIISTPLLNMIKNNIFFSDSDGYEEDIRKIEFANYLSYYGKCLGINEWLYIADHSRKKGLVDTSMHYYDIIYKELHDRCSQTELLDKNTMYIFWKSTYYYGYLSSYTKSNYHKAETYLRESLNIAEKIYCQNSYNDLHLQMIAASLDHLGYILSTSNVNNIRNITETEYILSEATELRKLLCEAHQYNFRLLHDYAWSLDNLGAFFASLNIENITFIKNPVKNDIEYLSRKEIIELYNSSDNILQEALEIRNALAKARYEHNSTEVAWTCFNLASLHINIKNYTTAEVYIKQALGIYRRINQLCPRLMASDEAKTLVLYAKLLSHVNKNDNRITDNLNKALSLYLSLDNASDYSKEIDIVKHLVSSST